MINLPMKTHEHSDTCRYMAEIMTIQCKNQSIIKRFFHHDTISNVFHTISIFSKYKYIKYHKRKKSLIFSFPLSVVIAVTALSFNVLGEGYSSSSGPWCWIKDCEDIKLNPVIWMAITGKFWEVLTYLGIFAMYLVLIFLKVKQHCRSRKVRTNP